MFQSSVDMDKKIQKQQQIYKRIKLLGTGAYGKAYLVKQIKTGQQFVIKQIIISDMSLQQQQTALRQAKILQALNHPNIIRFKQVYRTSKMKLNIVMEYASEGDLATRIKKAKKESKYFQEDQIIDWFTQICLGVKHIHDRKIIHRDLKAQNIFITSGNFVKIGDFGVSRILQKTAMNAKTVVGSPYYLSPEIIQNKPYSFQTDIWSLGALLYEMCALSPPFVANNLQFLALKIVKGSYGQIPNQYSYELKSLIKSLLNTDSSKRPNINKILTSRVISRRISNFLTESKRIDQFSHTIIHNKNILENKVSQIKKEQQVVLLPPPNLMNIEKQLQNKSQICTSNINFQLDSEVKSRPFTPQLRQKKSGNSFFNNNRKQSQQNINNKKGNVPVKKDFQSNKQDKNFDFNDLIKIKPSALEQKVKLPKVNTNHDIFDRRYSEVNLKNQQQKPNKNSARNQPVSAFVKKQTKANQKLQQYESEKHLAQNKNGIKKADKFYQAPKTNKISLPSARQTQNKVARNLSNLSSNGFKKQNAQVQIVPEIKPSTKVNKSNSVKRIACPVKKNSQINQVHTPKEMSNRQFQIKQSKKNSVDKTAATMQVVSQEIKKKANEQQQRNKNENKGKSQSKTKSDKNAKQSKKSNLPIKNTQKKVSRPPSCNVSNKMSKKESKKQFEKLVEPPRLLFQESSCSSSDSPIKQKPETHSQTQKIKYYEPIQNSKANDTQTQVHENTEKNDPHDSLTVQIQNEENYLNQEFENYQQSIEQQEICSNSDVSEKEQKLSLNLSESCKPHTQNQPNQNYNRMLIQLENIKNMVAQANGIIDTLPMFGEDMNPNKLLELSYPLQEVIREDDSQLESVLDDKSQDPEKQQIQYSGEHNKDTQQNNSKISIENQSNSSQSSSCQQTNMNIHFLSNQEHLQTLKMNLEQIFGLENVIFIHQFLNEVIEKEGLQFSQRDIQKLILFQKPQICPILLKKYFRLIVTVIIMEQQQNQVD